MGDSEITLLAFEECNTLLAFAPSMLVVVSTGVQRVALLATDNTLCIRALNAGFPVSAKRGAATHTQVALKECSHGGSTFLKKRNHVALKGTCQVRKAQEQVRMM